jgi:cytochrome d ubiquinol oxidase subunit I
MVAIGTLLSGYFIVFTDAWMQHPVGYKLLPNGTVALTSLYAVMTNPYGVWQYLHTINGALLTASLIVAGTGAYYLLANRNVTFGRMFVGIGLGLGLLFSLTQLFPTGSKHAENLAKYQPIKTAAMEGLYHTVQGAPLAIIGMPDSKNEKLIDPVVVPGMLSYLAYGHMSADVNGIEAYPKDQRPPVEVVYYAYHIMVGIGTIVIGIAALGVILLRMGKITTSRWYLWILMFSMPFPYIANEAGWTVAEVGRQPWIAYGLMRTAVGVSPNVSAGETIFTLLGFMGLYALIGLLFLWVLVKLIGKGPDPEEETPESLTGKLPKDVQLGGAAA